MKTPLDILLATRAVVEHLRDASATTPELAAAIGHTLEQTGAALSRLRRRGLVTTSYDIDSHGRTARHQIADWIRSVYETQSHHR